VFPIRGNHEDNLLDAYYNYDNYDTTILNGKRLIHGHKITEIQIVEQKVAEKAQVIPLDNGCAYVRNRKIFDVTNLGNLCCLDLDSLLLYKQRNIDMIIG
jgi:serine/threonine protein phosphatase 1